MTTTYKITIKDNSIPEHMQSSCPCFKPIHEVEIEVFESNINHNLYDKLLWKINHFINSLARELDTDHESLEILSIIKQ